MDDVRLDDTKFDAILLGTGLTQSILSAALSARGKKVFHADRNSHYGGATATFIVKELVQWINDGHGDSSGSIPASAHGLSLIDRSSALRRELESALDKDLQALSDADAKVEEKDKDRLERCRGLRAKFAQDLLDLVDVSSAAALGHDGFTYRRLYSHTKKSIPAPPSSSAASESATPSTEPSNTTVAAPAEDAPAAEDDAKTALPAPDDCCDLDDLVKMRAFSLDLRPHLVFQRSALVDVLLQSTVNKYLEFRSVEALYIHLGDQGMRKVPVSKADVFNSDIISLAEKRALYKFVQMVQAVALSDEASELEQLHGHWSTPFVDYLRNVRKLPERLVAFITYTFAMADSAQTPDNCLTTREAIDRMKMFVRSIGRFGDGAFLSTVCGSGEFSQGFSRYSAVKEGIFALRFQFSALVVEKNAADPKPVCRGLVTPAIQVLQADFVVSQRDQLPQSLLPADDLSHAVECLSLCICVVEGPVKLSADANAENLCMISVPPQTVGNAHPVRIVQSDHTVGACPRGKFVLYLSTLAADNKNADSSARPEDDLLATLQLFTDTSCLDGLPAHATTAVAGRTPRAVLCAFYRYRRFGAVGAIESPFVRGLFFAPMDSVSMGLQHEVEQARVLFHRMYPDEPFLEPPAKSKQRTRFEDDESGIASLPLEDEEMVETATAFSAPAEPAAVDEMPSSPSSPS